MAGLTRGSLPPGVYWRRRFFVLGLVAAVVALVAGVVRGGVTPADPAPDQVAEQAAAEAAPEDDADSGRRGSRPSEKGDRAAEAGEPALPTPLPGPQGACSPSDVVAEAVIGEAIAGREVAIIVKLRTALATACTFRLSAKRFTLTVTSGSDEIWASRHCPRALPDKTLVLRQSTLARVKLTWNAKRSDRGCTRLTQWALPGWYAVSAAALGGEPTSTRFELKAPGAAQRDPAGAAGRQDQERENDQKLHRTQR